jgi:hypothetical protein
MAVGGMGDMEYKKSALLVVIVIMVCMLGGCSFMKSFTDEKGAREFIEKKLAAKYGEEFTVTSIDYDTFYPQYDIAEAYAIPVADSEKQVFVYARSTGGFEDTYSGYWFKEEAEAFGKELLSGKAYIQRLEVKLAVSPQTREWKKEDGFREYISGDGIVLDFTATLQDGLEIEEYAELTYDILQTLYEPGINAELWVDANGENIFLDNYAGTPPPNPHTVGRIADDIKWSLRSNEMIRESKAAEE